MLSHEEENEYPRNFDKLINESKQDKNLVTRSWDLSLLFLEGRQWVNYDRNLRQYTSLKSPQSKVRVTVNLVLNIYRNFLSRLAITYPGVVALPASPSSEDVVKAKSAEIALEYFWNQNDVKRKFATMAEWMLSTGAVGLHEYYDPDKDQVNMAVVSPYDLFFESGTSKPEESEWISIRSYMLRSELANMYPDHSEAIKTTPSASDDSGAFGDNAPVSVLKNRIEIFETYWRDGKHAVTMGDTYLFRDHNPLDEILIQFIRYTELPRQLWGIGVIAPLIDLQWLYNKGRSQIIENVELMANPKWLIPKACGVSPQSINNRSGEKVYYNPAGGKPEQLSGVPIPSYVIENISRLQSEMMDIAGIHSTSMGKRAVGISSGKAIEALNTQDMSQLQITQLNIEYATQKMAGCVLKLMKHYYKGKKFMRMMDQTGAVIFHELGNTDLQDEPEIFIQTGSLFRNEAQDRDAKVLELVELGLLDPKDALKELSFRTGKSFVSKKISNMAHAQEMLDAVLEGHHIEIFASDDVEAFKDIFGDYMRTEEYYDQDPEVQEYVRDIHLSLVTAGMPQEAFIQQEQNYKVFPRKPATAGSVTNQAAPVLAPGSPATSAQMMEEGLAQQAGQGQIKDVEALMTNLNNGGGLG